jgi:hypothetical protein
MYCLARVMAFLPWLGSMKTGIQWLNFSLYEAFLTSSSFFQKLNRGKNKKTKKQTKNKKTKKQKKQKNQKKKKKKKQEKKIKRKKNILKNIL